MDISRVVCHDWTADPYARGTWCYYPPGWVSKYLESFEKPHGNILLASAGWSDGWRGWIDGAVEQGMQAAVWAISELDYEKNRGSTTGRQGLASDSL
ncbi:hypothetical protein H2198_004217 [Neophaeococcomyces mojaviensis]|uniref:Uncharacterized protein n=1 Tax=Neophaeococcomyces mojaviensis TaxID=3383035 RepID=A0ACC3A963_9EURO|nr:hypothetical protein H2198_004217 [Knufia sp. JES_112]